MKLEKNDLFKVVKKNILKDNDGILKIIKVLNVNKGTIDRWIKNEKIPLQYFNQLNKIMNLKFELNIEKEEWYKVNDMFFTSSKESKRLIDKTLNFISSNWDIDFNEYFFIDPSAGDGSFLNNFPLKNNKIGLDLNAKNNKNIIKKDYFDFFPKSKKNIVIGNPPFGLRGNLALNFINHSAKFADFICFVLPPLFNSNGKGSPMLRINKEFFLAKEFTISEKMFFYPNGKEIIVNSIFQIWTKIPSNKIKPINPPNKISEWVKIFSLSDGNTPSSKRNVNMFEKCDFYLPSTTFNKIEYKESFKELPHKRGYGIIFKKQKKLLKNICSTKIDWNKLSFKSTNGANNLRTQIIIDAINEEILKWI